MKRWFHVGPLADEPVALFFADDEAGNGRVLTNAEAPRAEAEARRVAEARVRDLEALLRSKG